jgi:hypothetical protein
MISKKPSKRTPRSDSTAKTGTQMLFQPGEGTGKGDWSVSL